MKKRPSKERLHESAPTRRTKLGQEVCHVERALRHVAHLQTFVHRHFAQFGERVFLAQTLALHQKGFGAIHQRAFLQGVACIVAFIAQALFIFEACIATSKIGRMRVLERPSTM